MARRARNVPAIVAFEVEEDRRPRGTVRFADPSTAIMTQSFNTFNDPHSPGLKGEGLPGIRSIKDDVRLRRPYPDYFDGAEGVREMNRRRGVGDEEE